MECPNCQIEMIEASRSDMISRHEELLARGTVYECVYCGIMMLEIGGGRFESGLPHALEVE